METLKARCFLVSVETKAWLLVYRANQNDYSFPEGHNNKKSLHFEVLFCFEP